ncbi:hypothetical protein BKG95_10580 [Rodentibacter pneumotropicus]|nr:hypothetical protein BKG95_10580 [Rodentibacter pneumotropicus]
MDLIFFFKKPYIITVACTKGGSAKSTNAANIDAFWHDHQGWKFPLLLKPFNITYSNCLVVIKRILANLTHSFTISKN